MPKYTSKGYPYGADFNPRGNRKTTRHIVGHHNVSPNNRPDEPQAENIVNFHMRPKAEGGRAWASGGYNDVFEQSGAVVPLIHRAGKGAHVGVLNGHAYGFCVIGDGRKPGFFNEAQQDAVERRIRQLLELWPGAEVCGHRDLHHLGVNATLCPAFDFKAWWAARQIPDKGERIDAVFAVIDRFHQEIAALRTG